MPDKVNSQIIDAVTLTNVSVLGESPAQSMGLVYQTMGHSIGLTMQNAVGSQNAMQQLKTAVVSTACRGILSLSQQGSSNNSNNNKQPDNRQPSPTPNPAPAFPPDPNLEPDPTQNPDNVQINGKEDPQEALRSTSSDSREIKSSGAIIIGRRTETTDPCQDRN
ncbi:MAG: hypothetical protein F6J93_08580 [Oscillatoria sp. SIO1A7]|nr:hypothetical protein [Oscillatoria sp. SIO1A7]